MKKLFFVAAALVFAGMLQQAAAGQTVYTDPGGQGTQSWGGNLALNFTVNSPITVDALGVFNAQGNGIITGTIDVAIYNISTPATPILATPIVSFNGAYTPQGLGYDVFQSITPVTLSPGLYEVDAVGFGSDLNGNLNAGSSSGPLLNNIGGALTFTGAAWDYNTTLDAPVSCPSCQGSPSPQAQQFDAGTFQVPEGGSPWIYLLLAGIVSLGAVSLISVNKLGARA